MVDIVVIALRTGPVGDIHSHDGILVTAPPCEDIRRPSAGSLEDGEYPVVVHDELVPSVVVHVGLVRVRKTGAVVARVPDAVLVAVGLVVLMVALAEPFQPDVVAAQNDLMADAPQIMNYLDIPLQHGHRDTLLRMRRPANVDWVYRTIANMRNKMPDLAVRTTFIVGYPGETDEEFAAAKQKLLAG